MENRTLEFFGVVDITAIRNLIPEDVIKIHKDENQLQLTIKNIKVVHYPDCQQLIIWLPEDEHLYESITLKDIDKNIVIWVKKIRDIISGSIQLIFDTLPIPESNFELTIKKKDGIIHYIMFKKYPQGKYPPAPVKEPEAPHDFNIDPMVYRDGLGNILPNEDLILRDRVIEKTINLITRRVEYVDQGRCGEVIYVEGDKKIKFYMEMGGGNCVFYLNIPSKASWEKSTIFLLDEREDIINYVAEQTQRDQASSCSYKISETEITYFRP